MEPLSEVKWDVVLGGTGLAESLLALSLSRSDKKILHVDRNAYYGGAEAALSLQDVDDWVKDVQTGASPYFRNARVAIGEESKADGQKKLGFARAYSIALAPQLIYTRSALIPVLVSSKVYRQLEFMAVGNWWIYDAATPSDGTLEASGPSLRRIPSRREDIFEDKSLDLKAKRAVIKFLRLAMDADAQAATLAQSGHVDLESYLTRQFGIPRPLQAGLHALTMSPKPPSRTPLSYALPRITRHVSSYGVFGSGFSAVVPKWGGLAEVAQVACRALAVGGGVYMLGKGIKDRRHGTMDESQPEVLLDLENADTVRTTWVTDPAAATEDELSVITRSVTIVAAELSRVLPPLGEGSPRPAAAVVAFPGRVLEASEAGDIPVYLMIHSSETGECPSGQAIIYASIGTTGNLASQMLSRAVHRFLASIDEDPETSIRWMLEYQQRGLGFPHAGKQAHPTSSPGQSEGTAPLPASVQPDVALPPPSLDLAFDDQLLEPIKAAWQAIMGSDVGFMDFEDREQGAYDSDEEG